MPDLAGLLSEEEKERVIAYLGTKWPEERMACPLCGDHEWYVGDYLVQPITLGRDFTFQLGRGPGFPQVMIISQTCGYTRFLNAGFLGLVPAAPDPNRASR